MNIRLAGALVAVAVTYGFVLLPVDDLGIRYLDISISQLALFGAPVAALLGWWFTPTAVSGSWRNAAGVGLLVGALAAPVGALEIAYVTLVSTLAGVASSSFGGLPGALFIATYGLGYSVLALPVTLPAGLTWAIVARGVVPRLDGRDPGATPFGLGELAIILAVVAVGAALIPLVADWPLASLSWA